MTLTIDDLFSEARDAHDRFWFVQDLNIIEQTNATVTLHLTIGSDLFVQAFLSQSSQRLSLALIGPSGRLYGRDHEHGKRIATRLAGLSSMNRPPKACPRAFDPIHGRS